MATTIEVRDLRHVRVLKFTIPESGVWLLTGANGTGKTTLLACMRRIGFKNAFPTHFPASRLSNRLDSYEGSSVTYTVGNESVTYTYTSVRWVPTPKAHSGLIQKLYPTVAYVAANADRIEPKKDDFGLKRVRPAPASIQSAANKIFGTSKFDNLRTISVTKGAGKKAYLLEIPGNTKAKRYFSEKNLSLGELCIIKLLERLDKIPPKSLVLIDELELALHPTAQFQLLKHLQVIAEDKKLTVVVSTHSATIIKQATPSTLLYLQTEDDGEIKCLTNCYPSYVLGGMASQEEYATDVQIYVEDEAGRYVLERLIEHVKRKIFKDFSLMPSVSVIAVGGIKEVLRLYARQKPLLPAITRAYAILDQDAKVPLENPQTPDIKAIVQQHKDRISYLPFTPEVGLVEFLTASRIAVQQRLREHYSLAGLQLTADAVGKMPVGTEEQIRTSCKQVTKRVTREVADQLPNSQAADVFIRLCEMLADERFQANQDDTVQWLGPILRG